MIRKTAAEVTKITELPLLEEICSEVVSLCNSKSLEEGICVHSPIIKLGLEDQLYLNNNLLSLYSKRFGLDVARQFFDEMPYKDVVSWTGILSAYVKSGKHTEALEIFDSMMLSGVCPNAFTFSSVLRSCSALGKFCFGKCIHVSAVKHGLGSNQILGSSLIEFYSKFDSHEEAYKLFGYVHNSDTVTWTSMISSFVQAGKWSQALRLYLDMIKAGVSPNEFTFAKIFAAASFLGLKYGKLLHAHMNLLGIRLNLVVKTALVDMYSRCQRIKDAIVVSKLTPEYDVLLWTTLISGLAQNSNLEEVVSAFKEMEISSILPNNLTYLSMINACSSFLSLDCGRQLHSRVIMAGLEDDIPIGNALIDLYMKCSHSIGAAFRVFREINLPNVISWTSLIAGLAEHGFQQDACNLFMEMRAVGVQPNSYTLSIILRACSAMRAADHVVKLHGFMVKVKADRYIIVANALVDAYAGARRADDAWRVLRNMKQRDAITYTGLATRLNQAGRHELALSVVTQMSNDNVKMDGYSLASFLSASASLNRIEAGKQLHCYSVKSGLNSYISVSNGLLSLYGKCGLIRDAQRAFAEINEPDVVSWNGLISGLVSTSNISSVLTTFDDMRLAGVRADSVTFFLVLCTCIRGGLVDMGLEYFHSMKEMHDIEPELDHYFCLIDLLGRAGRLEEAMEALETMPFRPDSSIYRTLLAACKAYRNVPLGEDIARRGLEVDPSDTTFYYLLADLYESSGRSDLAAKTWRLIRDEG